MFSITIESSFKSSHQLTMPDGSKEPAHDHDWLVEITVSRQHLDKTGWVMDFHELKALVNTTLAVLDNDSLKTVEYFTVNNPSAENVARYIFEKLKPKLPEKAKLTSVEVIEEPGCRAKFTADA